MTRSELSVPKRIAASLECHSGPGTEARVHTSRGSWAGHRRSSKAQRTYPVSPVTRVVTICLAVEVLHHGEDCCWKRSVQAGCALGGVGMWQPQSLGGSTPGCWKPQLRCCRTIQVRDPCQAGEHGQNSRDVVRMDGLESRGEAKCARHQFDKVRAVFCQMWLHRLQYYLRLFGDFTLLFLPMH